MSWTDSHLGNHLRIKHGFAFESDHFASGGQFAVLTPGHFDETGGFRDRSGQDKYYIGPFPEEFILNAGDLAIVMTEQAPGLIGAAATIPPGKKYLHNQRIGLITDLDESELEKEFLFQLLNSQAVRRQLHKSASGTKVRHSSPERIYATRFRKPPTIEQRRIAEILSAWDRAVSLTERLIAAKLRLRSGLMQQLLTGKRRFPEFLKSTATRETRWGTYPLDWGYPRIGEISESVGTVNQGGDSLPVLSCTKHRGLVDSLEHFGKQIFSKDLSTYKVVQRGQFA